jgi:Domain of unknown function (DUF4145)
MPSKRTNKGWPDGHLECRACRRRTAHEVLFEEPVSGDEGWMAWWEEYRVVRCRGCGTVAFERTSRDTESFDDQGKPDGRQDVYPRPGDRQPMEDSITFVEYHIDKIYKEALAAHNDRLPVLATMGIRALVEAICVEQGATKRNLEDKIDELVQNGTWPQSYHDALDEMRFLGNDAAHDLAAVSAKEWTDALDAVEHVMRAIYLLPAQAERLQQRRAKREAKKAK